MKNTLAIRYLGLQDYVAVYEDMESFTQERTDDTKDEIWVVEHPQVYTQGKAGKAEHILNPGNIPIIQTNRGGQVTFHGPGQIVCYFLLNIERKQLGVRELVSRIEDAMVATLKEYGIEANSDPDAPGVYISGAKIGSIGLRVTKGCTYHGLSLNIDMDLSPYRNINPCGYSGMPITQLSHFDVEDDMPAVTERLLDNLLDQLQYQREQL